MVSVLVFLKINVLINVLPNIFSMPFWFYAPNGDDADDKKKQNRNINS